MVPRSAPDLRLRPHPLRRRNHRDLEKKYVDLLEEDLEFKREYPEASYNNLWYYIKPLSLAGPLLTYISMDIAALAGGPQSGGDVWCALDLENLKKPDPLKYFQEDVLVRAILGLQEFKDEEAGRY